MDLPQGCVFLASSEKQQLSLWLGAENTQTEKNSGVGRGERL